MGIKIKGEKTDELLRLHHILDEWRKSQPPKKRGLLKLAKVSGLPYSNLQYQFAGTFKISDKLINFFVLEMGYRYEWIKTGEGARKKTDKVNEKKQGYIDLKVVLTNVQKLELNLEIEKTRRIQSDKELDKLKKELRELRALIADRNLVNNH